MSKIAFVTDFHFGKYSDSKEFLNYQEKFFTDKFFPYLEEHGIKTIIDLGDTFDNRKKISYFTLKKSKEFFFSKVDEKNMECYVVVGNHNLYFKESNEINSPDLLLSNHDNFHIVKKPSEYNIDGLDILFVPWISKENQEECLKSIRKTKSKYLFGHFEVSDMKLYRDWSFKKGLEKKMFEKFDLILSGHYHRKLEDGNFRYLGTPFQLDWGDIDYKKGFYVFDTETGFLEFIENDLKIFNRIEYSDEIDINEFEYSSFKESYVRIVLKNELKDFVKFDLFKERLEEFTYKIETDEAYLRKFVVGESYDNFEDTLSISKKVIDGIDYEYKDELKNFFEALFNEAKERISIC